MVAHGVYMWWSSLQPVSQWPVVATIAPYKDHIMKYIRRYITVNSCWLCCRQRRRWLNCRGRGRVAPAFVSSVCRWTEYQLSVQWWVWVTRFSLSDVMIDTSRSARWWRHFNLLHGCYFMWLSASLSDIICCMCVWCVCVNSCCCTDF